MEDLAQLTATIHDLANLILPISIQHLISLIDDGKPEQTSVLKVPV